MTDEEIKKFLNKCLDERFEEFRSGYLGRIDMLDRQLRSQISRECANEINNNKLMNDRLNAIQLSLNAQASGVQNVYDVFSKLTDSSFISDFNYHKNELLNKIKFMEKHLEKCEEFVKRCEKKMSVINEMYSLRNSDDMLIRKVADMIKIFEKDYD